MKLPLSVCVVTVASMGAAIAAGATRLEQDTPTVVGTVDVACTGIGDEAQADPRWKAYPVRLEFAGGENQYLADLDVKVTTAAGQELLAVRCDGPWLLAKLEPGKYQVTAAFENRLTKTATFTAPAQGQKRIVVHFPEVVGPQ